MSKVLELKRTRKELVAKLAPLAEKDALTPEEDKEFTRMRSQAEGLAKQIERLEFVDGERAVLARLDPVPSRSRPDGDAPKPASPRGEPGSPRGAAAPRGVSPGRVLIENPGFESVGELVYCAWFQPQDSRVLALMEMGTGESGGLPIPDDINPTLLEVSPQGGILRSRATVVPAGDSPDADLVLSSLNQSVCANLYGGVEVAWVGEGGDKVETSAMLKETRWSPKEVAAHIVITDKLLRNWRAASPLIERLLQGGLVAAEDVAFLKGTGGSQGAECESPPDLSRALARPCASGSGSSTRRRCAAGAEPSGGVGSPCPGAGCCQGGHSHLKARIG